MKKCYLFFLLIFLSSFVFADNLINTSDGRFLFITSVGKYDLTFPAWKDFDAKGDADGALILFDKNKIVKKVSIGGVSDDNFYDVCRCEYDGCFYAIGSAYCDSIGTGDFRELKKKGKRDCIIAKFDKNLKLLKTVNFGFGPDAYNFVNDILIGKKGEIYVCGRVYSESGKQDAFAVNFNTDLKALNYVKCKGDYLNGSAQFDSMIFNDKGNIIFCGSESKADDFSPANSFVTEFDKNLKKMVKWENMVYKDKSLILSSIERDGANYVMSGYVIEDEEYTVACLCKKNTDTGKYTVQTFVPDLDYNGRLPLCSNFIKTEKKDRIVIFGYGNVYMGNGDYEDTYYRDFALVYSDRENIKNYKSVFLPKNSAVSMYSGNNTEKYIVFSVVLDRETGEYRLVRTEF